MPVLGIIFLRHAANRFEAATAQIAADQTAGRMPQRKIVPADFVKRRALYLPEIARYDRPKISGLSSEMFWKICCGCSIAKRCAWPPAMCLAASTNIS